MANNDTVYSFDDKLEQDGSEFTLLPAGDYDFTVSGVERTYHNASDKVPECPEAKISLSVTDADGNGVLVKDNLLFCSKFDFKISAFFRAIGLKEKDKPMAMSIGDALTAAINLEGRCHIKPRTYNEKEYNNVDKYIDKQPGQKGYTKGAF